MLDVDAVFSFPFLREEGGLPACVCACPSACLPASPGCLLVGSFARSLAS